MANDFKGDPTEFAIVIPVPTMLQKGQIHIGSSALIEHIDAYSAPRLVEYYDENPCDLRRYKAQAMSDGASMGGAAASAAKRGVTIEAEYTIGEYDIVILSAKESTGLETWLKESGYKVPDGASNVLGSYIKQNMHFFVAKVNLKEQKKLGFSFLRPIQVAYESPKFMLPIRLGMVNASGPQDLFVFTITKNGRVESSNYRTVKLPEGMDLPGYVKGEFPAFYKAMFGRQVEKENRKAVFMEYAWDMGWCDPCAAQPLSVSELKELGVFWLQDSPQNQRAPSFAPPAPQAFLTRLHVRYDGENFPEDLNFHETSDKANFQARYVLRHPWTGGDSCPAAENYRSQSKERLEKEAKNLSELTGEDVGVIRTKMNLGAKDAPGGGAEWWKGIWSE